MEFVGFAGVEDGESRVDACRDGVFFEQARAEPVDGRDVRRFKLAQAERIVREQFRPYIERFDLKPE